MNRTIPIASLPSAIAVEEAVEAAASDDIAFIEERLRRGVSVLVECDKELSQYLYMAVRDRIKRSKSGHKLVLIDGRPGPDDPPRTSMMSRMLEQLREAVRGSVEKTIIVLLHLDVLTTTHTGLTLEAREAIPLLYENPEAVLLGFRDPSFEIPKVISQVFTSRREISGIPREALPKIVTQREARVMHATELDPFALYKFVSGLNPVRLRRLLDELRLKREAAPGRPQAQQIYQEIRRSTVSEDVDLPDVDLEKDIGGYGEVKRRLREELIDLVRMKDGLTSEDEIRAVEELLPRGVVFHGPPGTGKTYFAKAIATAMNATVIIVSGPELKSKWVGESEENLRRVFRKARQAAPSVIVFDEIDAFAHARGSYAGSGVEHSMVNQLLTEMDGFRKNEMVFVVGTTNFLESIDAALLRPGRFEFLIEIPAPGPDDRREIVEIYDRKLGLELGEQLIQHLVRRTEGLADRERGIPFAGDHLYAVARALQRQRLRTKASAGGQAARPARSGPDFTADDIDRALERRTRRPIVLSAAEERVIAIHEAGHALLAMVVPHATPPERISISPDMEGALGYVLRAARAKPYAISAPEMRAEICVGLGGHVAEELVLGEVSIGARADLEQATALATAMVEEYGMSSLGPRFSAHRREENAAGELRRARIDREIDRILREEKSRASAVLREHLPLHEALVKLLLEKKVLDATAIRGAVSPAKES